MTLPEHIKELSQAHSFEVLAWIQPHGEALRVVEEPSDRPPNTRAVLLYVKDPQEIPPLIAAALHRGLWAATDRLDENLVEIYAIS